MYKKKQEFLNLSYSSLISAEGMIIFCETFVDPIGGVVCIDKSDGISAIVVVVVAVVEDDGGDCVHSSIPFESFIHCSVCETYRPKST